MLLRWSAKKLVFAPEYGGMVAEKSALWDRTPPVAFFPAHWRERFIDRLESTFPVYRQGAFIAFHGS